MALPQNIDFDKLMGFVLTETMKSVQGWLKGRPTDEVALMNRLTENFSKSRRGCDVGLTDKIVMSNQVAMLHRQGANQIDLYGSDLAVTVYVENIFLKTALFQLKKGTDFSATLERRQLSDCLGDERYMRKSFLLYADEVKASMKLKSIQKIIDDFNDTQSTKTFNTSQWLFLSEWFEKWLKCEEGEPSDATNPNSPNSIENLLQKYVVEDDWVAPWGFDTENIQFLDNQIPAKAWLVFMFEAGDNDLTLRKKFSK